ncbi:DUF4419 domain-containing protein [Microcoleus sp. F10-C6]
MYNPVTNSEGTSTAARTFPVSKVSPTTIPLPEIPYYRAVEEFLDRPIEACSRYRGQLVTSYGSYYHPLIAALHAAFCFHHPICLSPDIIWLTLTQGLAQHINMNAEELRHHFVQHSGKLKITVCRDDFVKGSADNPWAEVFGDFSEQIHQHIGKAHELIVANFSTTGPIERAASEVVLLDAMQSYFEYELMTFCGIPTIKLEGTVEDWRSIAQRVEEFASFGLEWWVEPLLPILKEFVAAAEGSVNTEFWDSIYKYQGSEGSGSPYITGWVARLFPYIMNHKPNWEERLEGKTTKPPYLRNPWLNFELSPKIEARGAFPSLPSKAPFKWNYLGNFYEMEFVAGLIGVSQEPESLCLRPEIGWVVMEAEREAFPTK